MAGNGIAVQLIDPTTGLPYSAAPGAAALPAGTNTIGKVQIDQSTPGTTNGVQVNAALPAGTNNIGSTTGFVGYNETAGAVAIGAGGSNTLVARTPPAWSTRFNARVYSTQAGTLNIAEALAGGSTIPVATIAVAANAAQTLSLVLAGAADSYVAQFINGATAATVQLASSFTAN